MSEKIYYDYASICLFENYFEFTNHSGASRLRAMHKRQKEMKKWRSGEHALFPRESSTVSIWFVFFSVVIILNVLVLFVSAFFCAVFCVSFLFSCTFHHFHCICKCCIISTHFICISINFWTSILCRPHTHHAHKGILNADAVMAKRSRERKALGAFICCKTKWKCKR